MNPMTGSPAQYPGRVGEEQTVTVVQNHEDGARVRLAAWLRNANGNVSVASGLLSSQYSGGAFFENSEETSYDGPEGFWGFTLSGSGKVGCSELSGRSNLIEVSRVSGRHDDDEARTTKVGLVEHDEAHEGKVPFLNDSRSPDGVTVKTRGIPRS